MSVKKSRRGERHNVKRVFPEYRYNKQEETASIQPKAIREAREVVADYTGPIQLNRVINQAINRVL